MRYSSIIDAIGRTPLVELQHIRPSTGPSILAKCEHLNPGGSVKDRIAKAIVDRAEKEGLIQSGSTLIEATAGNTGIGLALVCAQRGYQLVCVMPEKMAEDKRQALRALGAEVIITDNAPPGDPRNFQERARQIAQERPNTFWTNQFANHANPDIHYETTGPEIWEALKGNVGAFVAGVGTGGTISGVGRFLKSKNPNIQIILADPIGSRLAQLINEGELGEDGAYLVEGIGSSQIPEVFTPEILDCAISISDHESFAMATRLIKEEGLLVGPSAGTIVAAALKHAEKTQTGGPIVALLPDSWDRYWSKTLDPDYMAQLE
jgi:cystathionine beta-synthase